MPRNYTNTEKVINNYTKICDYLNKNVLNIRDFVNSAVNYAKENDYANAIASASETTNIINKAARTLSKLANYLDENSNQLDYANAITSTVKVTNRIARATEVFLICHSID